MEDKWIDQRLRFADEIFQGINTPYCEVLKAGMEFRLRALSREEVRAQVEALMDKEPMAIRVWIEGLPNLEGVEDRALAVTGRLLEEIANLPKIANTPYFQTRASSCCEEREQLEGVVILLKWGGHSERLHKALKGLDTIAESIYATLPDIEGTEMLDRAANIVPDQWWAPMD
jgi:hypothetical protein